MKSILLPFYVLILLFVATTSFCQEGKKTLLWKIEGNEMPSPSYIYGTMHVSDKRVFNFSDSVFIALEACEAFALEVHPDSVLLEMFKTAQESFTNSYYEDLLTEEEFDRFRKKFKKINGFEFDDLENKNPLFVQQMMEPDFAKSDDKQTFVDGYLFAVAKMLRKEIKGLEDYKDQIAQIKGVSKNEQKNIIMSAVDYSEEFSKMMREEMVEVYAQGDLDKIQEYLIDSIYNDSLMLLRNKVMTESIVNVIKQKTLFSAVGAAHLIGKGSIIQMLVERGYQVTPVVPKFTGVADQYVPDIMKMPWEMYTDSLAGIQVELPGAPSALKTDYFDMMMFMDLGSETAFSLMNIDVRNEPDSFTVEKMIALFISNLSKQNFEIISQKTVDFEHGTRVEILLEQSKKASIKAQITKVNGFVHYLFVWSKKDKIDAPAVERFFNSTTYFPPTALPIKSGWFTYTDSINAFSIKLPNDPKIINQEIPNPSNPEGEPYEMHIIYSLDMANSTNYMVAYNDMPNQMYMENTEEAFSALISDFEIKGSTLLEIDTIEYQGVPGRSILCILNGGYHCKIKVFQKGNRTYKLLKQNLEINETTFVEDDFLESFTFLPNLKPKFFAKKSKFNNESFLECDNPLIHSSDVIDYDSYFEESYSSYSKNANTGGLYQIEMHKVSHLFRVENIDTFYSEFSSNLLNWNDTLIQSGIISVNGRNRFENIHRYRGSEVNNRIQFWIHNDIYYFIAISGTYEEIVSDYADSFFNGFNDNNSGNQFDYLSSKAQAIIDGINSKDSTLFKEAECALKYYYKFDESELPILHQSILKSYPDDSETTGIRCLLINELGILKNEESVDHLTAVYKSPNVTNAVKESVLIALADIDSGRSITAYIDLLFNSPPDSLENNWRVFYPFSDSTDLVKTNLSELMKLYDNENYKASILNTISSALKTNKDTIFSDLEPYFEVLTQTALDEMNAFLKDKKEQPDEYHYNSNLFNYMTLMDVYRGRSIADEFTKLFAEKDTFDYTQAYAMSTRIRNNLEIDTKLRNRLIDSLSTRNILLEAYQDINKLDQFPAKYLEPKELIKLMVFKYMEEIDYYPDQINLVSEIKHLNKDYFIYKISFSYDEGVENYLFVCGPITDEDKSTLYQNLNTYFDWTEIGNNWKEKAIELINKNNTE